MSKYEKGGKFEVSRVEVRDNDVEQALRRLKKTLNREGVFREMRMRRHYEKPFERRQRERREQERRIRKSESRRRYDS